MNEGVAIHKLIYENNIPVDYEIIDFNNAYGEILGINHEHMSCKKGSELYDTGKAPYLKIYSDVVQKGNPAHFETYFEPIDKYFSINVFSLSEDTFVTVFEDISNRKIVEGRIKKSLDEKEVLLREIHHRVKNNMQIISSLLNLQIQHVNGETVDVLKESQGRVKSLAMVHEKLYQSSGFTNINFKDYVEKLVYDILYSYGIKTGTIKTELNIEDIKMNMETAIPCGLIINELVTNSVKYAFPQGKGTIKIELKSSNQELELIIADNGVGIPENIDLKKIDTLGLQLVNSLVNQLEGVLELDLSHGTEFKIKFKELKYKNGFKII
jgi:two-component sensor histidine kinase